MHATIRGKIAATPSVAEVFTTTRDVVDVAQSDLTDVAAVVLSSADLRGGARSRVDATRFGLPVFAVLEPGSPGLEDLAGLTGVLQAGSGDADYFGKQVETAAEKFDDEVLPPFFGRLVNYRSKGYAAFDCPGHQGGQFFRQHPAGRRFFDFYGENLFRTDLCNADVDLGDLLLHEGAPAEAEAHAAEVFNTDRTYFVLNGTSMSNKVVTGALVAPGDLVLFDRNNHKSIHHGALMMSGGVPVYLETARNAFGLIGGIDAHCFEETYLRNKVAAVAPDKATEKRPFRLAVIQLGTYDGTIYNARQVVDRIGHLCDYILFDSAWVGYEQFIPMMADCSPLLLDLKQDDPGIIVTQSVHKQQAGFSQASQIHKKDNHIREQARYCSHDRFNNAFMMHASTSPLYTIFAALDVNAKMHADGSGERLWATAVRHGIEARKMILRSCSMIRPFIPITVKGQLWQEAETETIATNREFFEFVPGEDWHGFEGYEAAQYFVDPNKLLLTTPGLDTATGQYEAFGVPATILANYLRENGIIAEKCDLNSILFLMTPSETTAKLQNLVAHLVSFERAISGDLSLKEVLPTIYQSHEDRYVGYSIRQLAQEMHNFYKAGDVKQLQKDMFREVSFPVPAMTPIDANTELIRGHVELVPISEALGRTAAEGALPYPPGVMCVVPGEVWNTTACDYFTALEEGINLFPGFAPEIQGVHFQVHNGQIAAMANVVVQA